LAARSVLQASRFAEQMQSDEKDFYQV
jgi:hypothetical protein